MKKFNININDKFYKKADNWVWNYCTFLGKYTSKSGDNYDLGVYINFELRNISLAIVYGDTPGEYISGYIKEMEKFKENDVIQETIYRAKKLNLLP